MSYYWLAKNLHDARYHPQLSQIERDRAEAPFTTDKDRHEKLLNSKDAATVTGAISNKLTSSSHIDKLVNHPNLDVAERAVEHHSTSSNALYTALSRQGDSTMYIRRAAARHANATPAHLDMAIDDPHDLVKQSGINNKNASQENLRKAYDKGAVNIKRAILRKANCPEDLINTSLNSDDYKNRMHVFLHRGDSIKPHHIEKGLTDTHWEVREAAAGHHTSTSKHIDFALSDPHAMVRAAALDNRNATEQHVRKLLQDPHTFIRHRAERRLKEDF